MSYAVSMDAIKKNYNKTIVFVGLILAFLIAFAIRMMPYDNVFIDGIVAFHGMDPYFYMRHVMHTVTHFPEVLAYDSYFSYPTGGGAAKPLYPILISMTSLIIGLGSPSTHMVEVVGAIFPALLGALTIIPIYLIAKEIADWRVGLCGAFMLAINPQHIGRTQLGFTDTDAIIVLLFASMVVFFIYTIKKASNFNSEHLRKYLNYTIIYAIACGLTVTALFTAWDGAPILVAFFGIYGIIQYTIDQYNQKTSDYLLLAGTLIFATSSVLLSLLYIVFEPIWLSKSYVFIVVGIFAEYLFLGFFTRFLIKKTVNRYIFPLSILIFSAFAYYIMPILVPEVYNTIVSGFEFLGRSRGVLQTVAEAASLSLGNTSIDFVVMSIIGSYSFVFYLIYLLIEKNKRQAGIFFIIWTILVTLLAFQQERFMYLLSINLSILVGFAFVNTLKLLKMDTFSAYRLTFTKEKKILKKSQKRNQESEYTIKKEKNYPVEPLVLIILLFIFIVPNIYIAEIIVKEERTIMSYSEWYDALTWMRDSTPNTQFYNDPQQKPEYGVMSWWDYGYWITYIAHRPSFSNPGQAGAEEAASFFMSQDENETTTFLEDRDLKYVIVDRDMSESIFPTIAKIAGYDPSNYRFYYSVPMIGVPDEYTGFNESYFTTIISKLFIFDGRQTDLQSITRNNPLHNPLQHYRLVYDGGNDVKIFEYVPGATITGNGPGEKELTVSTIIKTNHDRTFAYVSKVFANKDGVFSITVPYATIGTPYDTKPIIAYNISTNSGVLTTVDITDSDIENGTVINVGYLNYTVDDPIDKIDEVEIPTVIRSVNITPTWTFNTSGNITVTSALDTAKGIHENSTTIYTAINNGDIFAIDSNGLELWKFPTGRRIFAAPTFYEDSLYVATLEGTVYSIDKNGKQIWSERLESGFTTATREYVYTQPLVYENTVYIGSNDKLYAFDSTTGKQLSSLKINGTIVAQPAISDEIMYITSFTDEESMLSAIYLQNTTFKWNTSINDYVVWTSPVVYNNTILLGSRDKSINAFETSTGEKLWTYETNAFVDSTPVVSDDIVYFGSYDRRIYALDIRSGNQIWVSETLGPIYASPILWDELIFIGTWDKKFYTLDKGTGTILNSYKTGDYITANAAVANGYAYVGSADGNVYAFSIGSLNNTTISLN